jgi:RNA polymerase sigma factor (sigma-70 family)
MRKKRATKRKSKKGPTFEESIHLIDEEIRKRKNKWNLTALAWMDYEDVSQIIRLHIYKKWDMYDPVKPLGPWLNRIISNQIKNLIRNHYGNYSRPCLRCAAAEGEDLCEIYEKQCSVCPLYSDWEKNKKNAYDIKMPLPMENHQKEADSLTSNMFDVELNSKKLHSKMQEILKPIEWKIYSYLYIDNKSEKQVAKLMGYRTTEKNRSPGYKQIKNIKKSILEKVKKVLKKGEIDFF